MIPQLKKILYATDLTKNSAYAFFYAIDMARKYDARIVILHSIERIRYFADEGDYQLDELLIEAKKEERKTDLEEIRKRVQEFCQKRETQMEVPCGELVEKILVPLGHPVEEILKAADDESCDAIVLGTHGKGFLRQTFLGSVAGSVLERTRKPIFVIPLPSEETDMDWDKL